MDSYLKHLHTYKWNYFFSILKKINHGEIVVITDDWRDKPRSLEGSDDRSSTRFYCRKQYPECLDVWHPTARFFSIPSHSKAIRKGSPFYGVESWCWLNGVPQTFGIGHCMFESTQSVSLAPERCCLSCH